MGDNEEDPDRTEGLADGNQRGGEVAPDQSYRPPAGSEK